MKELVSSVNGLLFEADPIGLAALGAPSDEYEAEAEAIVIRLRDAQDLPDVVTIVHAELTKWFGAETAGPRERYEDVSRSIWKLWESSGAAP